MYNILIDEQKRLWLKKYWGDILDVDKVLNRSNRLPKYKELKIIREIAKKHKMTGLCIVGEKGNIYD